MKIEMIIDEKYGEPNSITHKIGMNSAKWRIYPEKQEQDYPIFYQNSLSVSLWMILATVIVILLVLGSRLLLRVYNKYKKNKVQLDLLKEEANETN